MVATSSAGGGLRVLVAGVIRSLTAESAERAALGAEAVSTDLGVAGVAERAGFRDGSYFSRVFRRETGLTPSAYRRQARSGGASRRHPDTEGNHGKADSETEGPKERWRPTISSSRPLG
ncbi:MAG: glutamate mutase L [Firmicutes bacterium]|nr:glutamate mutase L [Bacillota bacterium]